MVKENEYKAMAGAQMKKGMKAPYLSVGDCLYVNLFHKKSHEPDVYGLWFTAAKLEPAAATYLHGSGKNCEAPF